MSEAKGKNSYFLFISDDHIALEFPSKTVLVNLDDGEVYQCPKPTNGAVTEGHHATYRGIIRRAMPPALTLIPYTGPERRRQNTPRLPGPLDTEKPPR